MPAIVAYALLFVHLLVALPSVARADLVGKIDAEFAVSDRGGASWRVPVVAPPGTAGMQPELSLVYDSQAGNGPLGVGFALGGLSAITRCPSDLARDGEIRAVAFDADDRLCLDGQRLVLVSGSYGVAGSEYRTERESFARVVAVGAGPERFEVSGRDGLLRSYGSTADSRIEAQGRSAVRVWALARTEDRSGNAIRFGYTEDASSGEFALDRVDYTENLRAGLAAYASLRFVWEARPDSETGFVAGSRISTTRRLARLETFVDDERVREYRLAYETSPGSGRSRIASIAVCGLGGECLPPTRLAWLDGAPGWVHESAWALPRQLWRETRQEGVLGDIDGDGRLDLVHGGNATQSRASWLNTGDGFASASDWRPPQDLFSASLGMPHALLADLDGDGLPEFVRSYRAGDESLEVATYLNLGDGWRSTPSSAWKTPSFIWDYKDDHPQQTAVLADVNGDGLPDWVESYESQSGTEHRETRLNTGSGFGSATSRWSTPVRLFSYKGTEQQTQASLVDLNGDDLPDLVQAFDDPESGQHRGVWLNTGSGFSGPVAAWQPPRVIWDYEHASPRQEAELVDVNADGLADFVVAFKGNTGSAVLLTYLNTGAGWLRDSAWDLPTFLWNYENGKNRQTAQLTDVNGDGYPDLVRAHVSADGVDRRDTWLNTGSGFPAESQSDPRYTLPEEVWSYSDDEPKTKATFADLDGDGVADFAKAYRTSSPSLDSYRAASPLGDRIVAITDGLGAQIEIEYAPLTDPTVHEIGVRATHPEWSVVDARPVVRRFGVGTSAGTLRWTALRYGGLRADRRRRTELGFAWRSSEDVSSGLVTTVQYRQDWPLQGLVDVAERAVRSGDTETTIERARHTYAVTPGVAVGISVVTEVETRAESFELDGTPIGDMRTTRLFDAFGNATEELSELGGGYARRTSTAWRNDPARWLIGLAERVEVTGSAPGFPAKTRVVEQLRDPTTGLLVRSVADPDLAEHRVQTDLTYDAHGNPTSQVITGPDFEPRTRVVGFDPRGRFPVVEFDSLGHARVRVMDPRTGVPLSLRGPDISLPAATLSYDALGRVASSTRPDGVTTTTTREVCGPDCPALAAISVRMETPGRPASTSHLDPLGREVRAESTGFDGRPVRVDTAYDPRGNVGSRTRPYYADEGSHVTVYEYDALGRPVRATAPDGSETRWMREGRSVTVVDPLGHAHTETRNARGDLVETIDALGARTSFVSDALGKLVLVRDPSGNETRFAYDAAGRQVSRDDPDLGIWSFAYDALGQLKAQLDARGTITHFTYDGLGRPLAREGDGPAVRWTWDTAEHGVGQLARVETAGEGFVREHAYDAFGRPIATATTAGVTSFSMQTSYDSAGREATLRYPTGFTLRYGYTASGHLETVGSASGSTIYWRAEAVSAEGSVERERLGNGLVTDRISDPETGRLTEILTGTAGSASIQSLQYAWSPVGNLASRTDRNAARTEGFLYDALDRLVRASQTGVGSTTFAYDALGNLAYKTGVGAYAYPPAGEPRPHAVTSAGHDPRSFEYDANGNLLADSQGQALVWSPRNQPIAIATSGADGGWEFFGYTPDGELLTRLDVGASGTNRASYVLQLGNLFEQVTDLISHRVERRHMIYAAGALVAVHVAGTGGGTRYVHRDHLGSVDAVTNAAATVVERIAYDVHGASASIPTAAARGFTGAVTLERSRLVHMQGRVYDPRLGRFLSPDPLVATPNDLQSLNRYAYVRNNPLSLVDPTGYFAVPAESSGTSGFGAVQGQVASGFTSAWGAVSSGVSAAGSFLSSAWGGVRFGATAAWNGLSWAGSQLANGGRWAGAGALAGAGLAWSAYRSALPASIPGGVLPDQRVPGGILQSIYQGVWQFAFQELEIYDALPQPNGADPKLIKRTAPIKGGNLYVNGQLNDPREASRKGANEFGDQPFIMLYNREGNLVSDTVESALMKFAPSRAGRQLAVIMDGLTESTRVVGHSQGALTAFWGLRTSGGGLSHVAVDFFGPATSSWAYHFALWTSGAHQGPHGYLGRVNDPVSTYMGGNFTGGWLAPLLFPMRLVASAPFIPLLASSTYSPHSDYP